MNWNNKPVSWWNNGDNIPWAFDNELDSVDHTTDRVILMDDYVRPLTGFTFENLKNVPRQINSHGTYQQAIEWASTEVIDENILPPGQSGFVNLSGEPSPHCTDQWPLHVNWEFKDMLFGQKTDVADQSKSEVPYTFSLYQNCPNPFNPVTRITYSLPAMQRITLKVFDMLGREVVTLVHTMKSTGTHEFVFDASNLQSGIYVYELITDGFTQSKKMILLK